MLELPFTRFCCPKSISVDVIVSRLFPGYSTWKCNKNRHRHRILQWLSISTSLRPTIDRLNIISREHQVDDKNPHLEFMFHYNHINFGRFINKFFLTKKAQNIQRSRYLIGNRQLFREKSEPFEFFNNFIISLNLNSRHKVQQQTRLVWRWCADVRSNGSIYVSWAGRAGQQFFWREVHWDFKQKLALCLLLHT